jgi:IclR family transcriptional regulator, acetate operon repressor
MVKSKAPDETIGFLSTVERAMRVLEDLADEQEGLSVSELARRLDTNKSIVVRILTTMEKLGYLFREKQTQHYRLTYRIANLALRQLSRSGLVDQCAPVLQELAEQTGEHVRLAVIEADQPVWIHAVSGAQRQLRVDPVYGHEVVLHSHAAGKAWLMTLEDDEIDRVCGRRKTFPAQTKYTITSLRGLKDDVAEARKRGFALSYEENELGVGAVAAPILIVDIDKRRKCVGVISLAAPTSRMDRAMLIQSGNLVMEAATHLARAWPVHMLGQSTRPFGVLRVG